MHVSPILANKLLVGSCPENEADIEQLKAAGVSAVLNLQTDEDFGSATSTGGQWRPATAGWASKSAAGRSPISHPATCAASFAPCVRLLNGLIQAGHAVYVHCNAGINRSPTAAVAYLHWVQNGT